MARRGKADNCIDPEHVHAGKGVGKGAGKVDRFLMYRWGHGDLERSHTPKMNLLPVDWREGFWVRSLVLMLIVT